MTPATQQVALARFKTVKAAEAIDVEVHFNPASLSYSLSNALQAEGDGDKKKQYVSQTSATLTMDLVFDTTDSGDDVREATDKMAKLLRPHGPSGKQVPPLVEFSWGAYSFNGMVSQYKETIDYFSADGVPLRSSINLTLTSQDVAFDSGHNPGASVDGELGGGDLVTLPSAEASFGGAAGISMSLGDPRAARAIASVNGSSSLRFSGGVEMAVGASAGISLSVAAAFSAGASAGFGIGVGAGAGVSVGAGVGVSASASAGASFGAGASAGASFGAGASGASFGAGASAGGSFGAGASTGASAGASFGGLRGGASFGGLRAGAGASAGASASLPSAGAALALTAGSQQSLRAIGVGGKARAGGRASLGTDVGARASIRFGD